MKFVRGTCKIKLTPKYEVFRLFARTGFVYLSCDTPPMKTKQERQKSIKSFLMRQTSPVSITDVYEALIRSGDRISRKTIERDMGELIEAGSVMQKEGVPIKFVIKASAEIELILSIEELKEIIAILPSTSLLKLKIENLLTKRKIFKD